jgi:hypothetical protein
MRQENEQSRIKRKIQKGQRDREVVVVRLAAERRVTATAAALGFDLSLDIRGEKKSLQADKVKTRNCETEIEGKHREATRIVAQIGLAVDDKMSNIEKREEDTVTLHELTRKNEQQTDLIEKGRKERNGLKRRFEAALREQVQLRNTVDDLALRIRELRETKRARELGIVDSHFRVRECHVDIDTLEAGAEELEALVLDGNHSISALSGEFQVLSHILGDAASDRLLQSKEFEAARDTRKALCGILVQRRTTADELRNHIQTARMDLHKGGIAYAEKLAEIAELRRQMDANVERNIALQLRCERLAFVQHEQRRIFGLYVQESEKTSALTYEAAVPRNVHRWQMYSAVDPAYAMGIRYLARIYGRIDAAHRTLVALVERREKMRRTAAERHRRAVGARMARDPKTVPGHIESYKADVAAKDEALTKLGGELDRVRNAIADVAYGIDLLRGKVCDRRSVMSELRGRNLASRGEKRQALLFMTEPEAEIPLGGGFVLKAGGEPERQADGGVEELKLAALRPGTAKIGTPGPTARVGKGGKKILRPQTVGVRKRAQTSLGPVFGEI